MKRIVIVEDEEYMREELAYMFSQAGYEADCVTDFVNAADRIIELRPDLVVLDVNLPGTTGFTICRMLKEQAMIPVLVLTSRDQIQDELHALGLGADEFLTKPCRRERLLARAENLMKRYESRKNQIGREGFSLDRQTFVLYYGQCSVILPENQGKLMELLLCRIGETVTKNEMFQALWGTTEYIDENALQVNMTRLKRRLSELDAGWRIEAVRGIGYRLREEMEDAGVSK